MRGEERISKSSGVFERGPLWLLLLPLCCGEAKFNESDTHTHTVREIRATAMDALFCMLFACAIGLAALHCAASGSVRFVLLVQSAAKAARAAAARRRQWEKK